jgi:diguanylate cyclase (GGDEF)-like protein
MGRRTADLADHLWAESLQEVQDTLGRALGVPLLLVDPAGRPLAVCEDLNEFCRWLTRAIPLSRPCLECGRSERLTGARGAASSLANLCQVHSCPLGVADAAVPIWSAGDIIGYLVTAQVCLQPESHGESLPAAAKLAEAEEHVALLARLPRCSRQALERAAAGLAVVASFIGSLAASRRRNLRLAERIREQTRWIQANEQTDAVTGLANRRHFCATLEGELARVRRYQCSLSLAVLDVAQFHHINEEFGHEAGDGVLRAIAQALASTIRQTDVVGRLGGDEFGIIFTETGREGAMIALARIAAQIEDLNASGELPVEIRLNVGLCEYALGVQDLLAGALEDLQRAKERERLPC